MESHDRPRLERTWHIERGRENHVVVIDLADEMYFLMGSPSWNKRYTTTFFHLTIIRRTILYSLNNK